MNADELKLSVTQLNEYVKMLVDSDELLQAVIVEGEISNFKHHYASGHMYFSLKDDRSVIKCVMFSRDASRLVFLPENGMRITAWGRVSVFPRDGAYQLYVGYMSSTGLGDRLAAIDRLKNKLSDEGLLAAERKRKLPEFPKRIGIVTSPTGAAIRDILNILHRRWPVTSIELFPSLVQGTGAAESLREGLRYFNKSREVDVIIIGRGGGSGEDLDAFNDEMLARAISASSIPVISAVGHETDITISDLVADLRAPTPSAAAELAVPSMDDYLSAIDSLLKRINALLVRKLEHADESLRKLSCSAVLMDPARSIALRENEIVSLAKRIDSSYRAVISHKDAVISDKIGRLDALNPLSVLSRGYSFVQRNEHVVSSASELASGDDISLIFSDGSVDAVIK